MGEGEGPDRKTVLMTIQDVPIYSGGRNMISMQQLEELESRVVKALQLITELRSENA
jgi:hypothetical protein